MAVVSELNHQQYMIKMDQLVDTDGLVHMPDREATNKDVCEFLRKAYCSTISSDLSYLSSEKQEWMAKALEEAAQKVHIMYTWKYTYSKIFFLPGYRTTQKKRNFEDSVALGTI